MDLLRLMFIDEECGNLKVVVDGGELTRNINGKKKSDVLKPINVYSVTNSKDEIEVNMIFLAVTFFCGLVVNKLRGRKLFPDVMNRNHLDLILGRSDRIVAPWRI